MASPGIIIDAGPLYALLDRRDQHHIWALQTLPILEGPFQTCDAVLSEVFYLLEDELKPRQQLRSYLESGLIISSFESKPSLSRILELLDTYSDLPMSFADACLVCMVESRSGSTVFTTDSDFKIYRQERRRPIPLIAPFGAS